SGHRFEVQEGHAAAVARTGHPAKLGDGRLRYRLQLRVWDDAGVGITDDTAADPSQPETRVRAVVWRWRSGFAAVARYSDQEEHPRFDDPGDDRPAGKAWPGRSLDALGLPRCPARSRTPHSADRGEERRVAAAGVRPPRHRNTRAIRRSREVDVRPP